MEVCAVCSTEVLDDSTICPVCGTPAGTKAPTLCDIPTAAAEKTIPRAKSEPHFVSGTVLASRYRIVTTLGRGGMGEVYRADDLKLNQSVALKFLRAAKGSASIEQERLRQEVRLARQISHPNVCRVFDLGEIDGHSFLCMEHIDGEDLASLLRRIGRLPVDKALEIARQVAAGLAAIHDGGLLHRDLKPGNVMIDGRGRARITDFGLAVVMDEVGRGRKAGTPAYMAPELRLGAEASIQSDLHALGLVTYEMLVGRPVFTNGEPPALPDGIAEQIDARIRTILRSCLEPTPALRPPSALHVVAALTGEAPWTLAVSHGLAPAATAPLLDLGRLPTPGPLFLGRDAELARLNAAWEDPGLHVITLVAFGGVGKSALVAHWLDGMAATGWRGATRVLDWSFYSQGTNDRATSAEPFIDYALRVFGDPDPKAGSLHDRGARLASLIRKERTLLILDGVEPLQYPPGPMEGRLKDPGLTALLKGLAAANPGLCVVTTREKITDLAGSPRTAPQVPLDTLDTISAVELLRRLGVAGPKAELEAAAVEFGGHALALTLLGTYLHKAHGGDIRRRREIPLDRANERQGGHAFRVIAASARWLGEGPELAILRLLGLFDRPAPAEALAALRKEPPIPGLTEPLVDLSEEAWQIALTNLRDHGLLAAAVPWEPGTLDAHPLVRAFFAEELEEREPEAWREGNLRLYEHLRTSAAELPDTLEAMQPLYVAIIHACRAGRPQEALDEVYRPRVSRLEEHFSLRKLGAFGSELTALAAFFDFPWSRLSAGLTAVDQVITLSDAAFILRALGRLTEAAEPMQAALEAALAQEDWKEAATSTNNLSELTLVLGDAPRAVAFSKRSVELSDRSGNSFLRIASRTAWADALHQAGRWEESAAAFYEAEALQVKRQPEHPRLFSIQGYRYRELLLSRAEPEDGSGMGGLAASLTEVERFRPTCEDVLERAKEALRISEGKYHSLLDVAINYLSLGRAYLGLALTAPSDEDRTADLIQAAEALDRATEGFRKASREDYLPRGLLARAALRRFRSDFAGAAADLAETLEIAERGPMRLFECDANLEWARLCRDQGDLAAARRHVARARELVRQTGYGRREREVAWLEAPPGHPAAP